MPSRFSESFELYFLFCFYYPFYSLGSALTYRLKLFFEENPYPCLRQQVQPHGRYNAKNQVSSGSAWPDPILLAGFAHCIHLFLFNAQPQTSS